MHLHKLRLSGGDIWLDDFKLSGICSLSYDQDNGSNVPPTLTVTLYVEPFDTDAEPNATFDDNTNPIGISG